MGKLEKNTCGLTDFCHKTSLMYIVYCYIISDTIWQVLSSGGSRCKLLHLHIQEYSWKLEKWLETHWREKQEATTRNMDHVIVDLPYIPMTISTGCQQLEILTLW